MTIEEVREFYLSVRDSDKQIFLAFLSHDLTIHGRAVGLDLTGEKEIRAYKGLNELQHQISSHIAALGIRRDRWTDEDFWEILVDEASRFGLSACLKSSLMRAGSRNYWNKSK
jgi:hypothetical protein